MWIFWALLSAVLVACRRPFEKSVVSELHHLTYGFWVQCVSLPILACIVLVNGKFLNPINLGLMFWAPLIAVSIVFPLLGTYLYTHAITGGELSKVLPLQSLWPVFALILGWLTLGEVPGLVASGGVAITVLGVYALGLKGKRLHHPFQPFREDSSSRAMLASVLLTAGVGVLDKTAVQASNPLFYSFSSCLGALLTISIVLRIRRMSITLGLNQVVKQVGVIGVLQGTTFMTYLLAIAAGPVAYVSALRSTNILLGSVIGIVLFSEKLTKPKVISFLLIIAGAICLTLGS